MGKWSRHIKDRACKLAEGYDDAMDEKFNEEFKLYFKIDQKLSTQQITYDDIKGFLDSFETPEENEWALAQAEAEVAEMEDAKMQLAKDER